MAIVPRGATAEPVNDAGRIWNMCAIFVFALFLTFEICPQNIYQAQIAAEGGVLDRGDLVIKYLG